MRTLFFAILLSGCAQAVSPGPGMPAVLIDSEDKDYQRSHACVQNLEYVRDTRTDLCFAVCWGSGQHGGPGLANVPCFSLRNIQVTPIPLILPENK